MVFRLFLILFLLVTSGLHAGKSALELRILRIQSERTKKWVTDEMRKNNEQKAAIAYYRTHFKMADNEPVDLRKVEGFTQQIARRKKLEKRKKTILAEVRCIRESYDRLKKAKEYSTQEQKQLIDNQLALLGLSKREVARELQDLSYDIQTEETVERRLLEPMRV